MKKVIAILVVLVMLFAVSCSKNDGWIPAGMQLASTDAVDYTMYVPETWTVDVSTGIISAYVSDLDRSNVTMVAFNLEGDNASITTADEYWEKNEPELVMMLPDFRYISEEEAKTAPEEVDINAETTTEEIKEEDLYKNSNDKKGNPIKYVIDGNVAANKYYYKATITGTPVVQMQVAFVRGGYAYLFTYSASEDSFASHLEEVESILSNFTFSK